MKPASSDSSVSVLTSILYTNLVTAVLVFVLLMVVWHYASTEGATVYDTSGSTVRVLGTERSDGYPASSYVIANTRHNVVEGMNGNEPPVFWNSGDVNAIGSYQKNPANWGTGGNDYHLKSWEREQGLGNMNVSGLEKPMSSEEKANAVLVTEGMADMYGRKPLPYEGMVNRDQDPYSDDSLTMSAMGY